MADQTSSTLLGPTRTFDLRVVLTVTTGRLLTKPRPGSNGIEDLYEILSWMTDDSPYTHQLGRFAQDCKPWLLRWYPQLEAIELPVLDSAVVIESWIKTMEEEFGTELAIGKIPRDDHEQKNPYDELVAMRGTDEGIIAIDTAQETS